MCSGADLNRDLIEMELHGFAVAGWQHQRGSEKEAKSAPQMQVKAGPRRSEKSITIKVAEDARPTGLLPPSDGPTASLVLG